MPNPPIYDEKQLLLQVAQGDEVAFAALYHHYYPVLYPFALKMTEVAADAEEIVQETFIRVWLYRDRLPHIEHFRAWIIKVSSRENLTYLKGRLHNREQTRRYEGSGRATMELDVPDEQVQVRDIKRTVQHAVAGMPEQRRRIYQLSRDYGHTPEEIAEILSISKNTVYNVLTTALKEIRQHLTTAGYRFPAFIYLLLKIF